jgi:hypothetical protein
MRALALLVFFSALSATANAAALKADHGVIVLNGKAITKGGHDSGPVLSPDSMRVVFLRTIAAKPPADCSSDAANAVELWSVNADGGGTRRLLAVHADPAPEKSICAFDNAQFSSSGRLLYFETPAWATSGAIHVLDLSTGKERFFIAGDGVKVLATCRDPKYRDDIIAGQHRYFVFSGSYDWDFLFTPDGEEVGPLGDGDHATDVADACG